VRLASLALLLAALAAPAAAQLDDRLRLGGAVEAYTGLRLGAEPAFLAARTRADLRLAFEYERGRVVLRPRLDYDALGERLRGDLREAYLDVFFDRVDLRLGHQQIVWGETDGTFVTDLLSPLDLTEFLAQPFDDLRLGVTAATATLYAGDWRATAVLVPRRPTSRLPEPGSPWYPLPPDVLGVPVALAEPAPEDSTLRAAEVAVRLTYAGLPRTDVAVLWISGFNRLPAFRKGLRLTLPPAFDAALTVTPAYARRHVLGLTVETLALDPVVLRGEAAFHTAYLLDQPITVPQTLGGLLDPEFQAAAARGFLIEKPFVQAALGLERAFGSHLFRVQALGSLVLGHDDRVAQDRFEPSFTALWNGRFRRETLTAQVFAFYTPGADYWLNPALTWAVRDALNASLGLQVFGGAGDPDASLPGLLREPAPSFATYDRNDFAYLRVSYSF
jgi:hypothetical protein